MGPRQLKQSSSYDPFSPIAKRLKPCTFDELATEIRKFIFLLQHDCGPIT